MEIDAGTPGVPLATDADTLVIFHDGYDVASADDNAVTVRAQDVDHLIFGKSYVSLKLLARRP